MTGARILADYPDAMVRIACRRCDRRGQYRRTTLIALYGEEAALPDVLAQLARPSTAWWSIAFTPRAPLTPA